MASNVAVDVHHPPTMSRPATADVETYQQCNYQQFQMLVHSVVDPINTDEVRLKHLQNIADNIEVLSTLHNYPAFIDLLVKNFLKSLMETDTVFIIPSNAQTIRKQMIEVFHRLPITEVLRPFVKDILSPMFKLLTKENEENALLLLRIVVEYMKQFRPQMINEVRDFLQFVHNVYRQKASALDQIFLTKTFSDPTSTINEIDVGNIIEQICSSVQLTVRKMQNLPTPSSITTDEAANTPTQVVLDTFTVLARASNSVKLLAEFPVAIVLLYQLCRQFLQAEFGDLVPLFLRYLTLQPSKEQKADPKFNMEIYIEFLTTQAKTLSFLAFVGKTYQDQLVLNSELLVIALLQLLDGCPPENVQLRKDIIVAARHFLSSDFRTLFIPHVKRFFDENLLLSSGYTARETLKPLAYNTFGDFFNHVRLSLPIEDLQSVLYMYSKMIHDPSLPPSIQVMSLKFLTNIAEATRQKGGEKSRDILIRVVEILVFKCKSLAKQCAHLSNGSADKPATPAIAPIPEADVATSSLSDLMLNMNDITNREKELQRQQLSLIRFQATSALNFTLSSSDCRTLLKVLVSSLRHITWILADVKISSENHVTQPKQFAPSITILYIKFFKYILQCLILFFDSSSSSNSNGSSSTTNNPSTLTRNKEEKEIMDMIASVFIVMHKQNYREIFENNLSFFYQCANKNPNITLIMNTLLQQSPSSTILVELLLEFLLPRINEIGESSNTNNACLKLFKLVINSVVTTTLANENEKILQPYLKQIILRSIECAQLAADPYNYFILLRALFRSIGVGNHELLNQEFLTLLHFLLQRLNEYQSCKHRQHLRELFIELCLTVPVRLSVLLPYLPLLMEPLVNALNGSPTLILQGLRTLELCVDNLQPDFLYNHILPVRSNLMMSLYRLLSHVNNDIAQNTFRILGKLGGNNRRILNEPQQIQEAGEEPDKESANEIYVQMFFENESKSISVPLLKILRTCADQLKSSLAEQQQTTKSQAWLTVRSLLSVLIANDDDHELVTHLLHHPSFLHGNISTCPTVWTAHVEVQSRLGHDLLLQCLHQAAACKNLPRETQSILKSTVQHYTLVAVAQQAGPLSADTYENAGNVDCSIVLIDSIVSCYIDIDDELNSIGRLSFDKVFDTLLVMFNSNIPRITQLPLLNYLVETLFNHCHDRMWYAKQGACRFLHDLCTKYLAQENDWFLRNFNRLLSGFFHVITSLTDEISSGTLDILSSMVKELLGRYPVAQANEAVLGFLLEYIVCPVAYVRNLVYDCLRQLSHAYQQPIARLIEPFKNDLIKKFAPSSILPLKNQSLIYQLAYLDVYIFFRTLDPKVTYVQLFDNDLFKELTTLVLEDNDSLCKQSTYRALTQQQLILNIVLLKKLALRTIAEYYEQMDYRDRVIRFFYKILISIQSNELQLIAYESIEKIFAGHQNDQLRLRFVESYLQQISFYDNEKPLLSPQVAQTLLYLSKLSPVSFDERPCDQILNLIRKLMQTIAQTFRTAFDAQNQYYKTCLTLLELIATLPNSSRKIVESLTILILKFDKHLMIESSSACRKHLIELLIRHPQLSLDQFITDENRLQDLQWSRLFLDLLKSSSSANIQTFVRTNWLDRFRQILSDHIVFIETTQNVPPIICITIRSLAILARADQLWWSRQHQLSSLLLRLWRSNTFQQHSFVASEHFDSFCAKELNNVLNLCLIYYQFQPERIRLLLELTRIYACSEKLFYPKKFFNFVQDTVIKTYSLKWKRDTLASFILLRDDESYTLECKSLFFEYIILPSFTYEFEHNKAQMTSELSQISPTNEEPVIDVFIRMMIDAKYLQQINDKYRICLLRFLCLFLEYNPQIICDTNSSATNKRDSDKIRRLMECAYGTLLMNNIDPTYKCQAHLLLCYIISKYSIVKKIIVHVFNSLLKSYIIDAKYLVRQATDLLLPAIPVRMDDGYDVLAFCTKKILSDDAHGNLQLIHIMSIIVRHQVIYFHVRHTLANLMIQSAQKIAGQQTNSNEHKKLAIDIIEVIIKWEMRKHHEQITDQRAFSRSLVDNIFVFLIRHACQVNAPNMLPLSQQCIRLFKIARKFAWPNFEVKLAPFERLIHQIESPNLTAHNSIAIAIDLLAFLISTFTAIQIKYTMRTLKRSLIACVSVTNNQRLVESMQNLFSKLIVQIPIEPPAAIIPNTATNNPSALPPQLVQATLASLATAATPPGNLQLSASLMNKSEDIEQFYTIITKTIIDNMNSSPTAAAAAAAAAVNTTDSARTTVGATPANASSAGFASIHTLPVAFGYLKIIEKQQPKYVDKLTSHITKLLQKLIKDHTSAGVDYNPAFTEYIIECLTLLKYRIGQLSSDLRKQFMNNFLPCLIEKSHDITLVRAIIRLVYDWLKWRGDVQLVPSLKEKSQMLLRLLQCIDKSGRFHQHQQQTNDNELANSFLELILHVYQESNYRELCIKLEAAFILGLKSTNQQLRKQFFLILDKNLRKTLHDRLLFIFLSQNWEYLGQHYWIKQCLELFYTCVSSNTPLSVIDNRASVLPSLTSMVKSGEFYDRYDFLIDYVKAKNPSSIESVVSKSEQTADVPIKMEVNDEASTQNPAYSIISNALGVTAMSTLVTKKQRSTSISLNEPKVKHFKRTISFENIRRFPAEKAATALEQDASGKAKFIEMVNSEIDFLKTLASNQSKPNELFDSIIQLLHTPNSVPVDKLAHHLFVDFLPKVLRIIPEKHRVILFQQIIQPFFVSGTHLQQRDLHPYSSLHTLLEAFYFVFKNNDSASELVPIIRPVILKYIGKTHNTWHRSILLLEQYILDQQSNHDALASDETYNESLNALGELYEHLNEDDYNISLWLHRRLSPAINLLISNALQYEQLGYFQQALDYYTQSIKLLETTQTSSSSSTATNPFFQVDDYSFLEQHWIKCTKELNQWDTLMTYCKQQSNRDHLLYLDCTWRSANWPLMKETLGQLDAMCNGTNMNLNNSSIQTFQFLNQNPTLTQSTIISNILTIKDFQWKFALYRCYLTLCSTITNTDDPSIYQTTMNITERLIDYCSLNALKEWKHLPNYVSSSHLNLLQASQRIIELQESAQILLNIQTNNSSNNTSTSIISTTPSGSTSTTTNVRPSTNIHELKTIVKTWKSRLPLINDSLSFWNDIFTWRELQYGTISSQFDKDLNGTNTSLANNLNNNANTGQVLLGIHAIAQSITQLGKIARKHQMPSVCMEILSRIGTVIPSVPVVDSFQKIKQIIKCYLILLPTLPPTDIQDIFDLIEQANTKYFNRDMMSEFYSLKAVAFAKLDLNDEAQKLFSCSAQLSDTNLTRTWINWGDFLLKQSSALRDDESIIVCYLNACKDLNETKARSVLSKIFYLLSRDNEHGNNNRLSTCIERYLASVPVQHWLFWLPQIVNKLVRNESSQCMQAILAELVRLYPQVVYVQVKKHLRKLMESGGEERQVPATPTTPSLESSLTLPSISLRQQAINNLNRLAQLLLEQHPTIVRTLDIMIEQLNTINETFLEYMVRRLYECQRKIYQDLFENKRILSDDVKGIIQHLKELLNNDESESDPLKQLKIQFFSDFNRSIFDATQVSRSFVLLLSKWINLIERRIEQAEPRITYLNHTKFLHLFSFNSQITNDICMPGELWHAPEANFFFRINKFFPTIERVYKHERYFHRLTIRAHNGKIMQYLLSNNHQSLPADGRQSHWDAEENTLQFLKMLNNLCVRKEKELLKRHAQMFFPRVCTYLPSLRLIEDNRSTVSVVEMYNDRLMTSIKRHYELIDDNNENLNDVYQQVQRECFPNRQLLHQWTLNEYPHATGYFSFRKIFTISVGFYSTLNHLFGFAAYANNSLEIQRSIGNVNPLHLTLQQHSDGHDGALTITPTIDTFINPFGRAGPLTATILATLSSFARPKYQLVEYLKIFLKEDVHIKHPGLTQSECIALAEDLARQLEARLTPFADFDIARRRVTDLVQTSSDVQQLSRLNPLSYPWL